MNVQHIKICEIHKMLGRHQICSYGRIQREFSDVKTAIYLGTEYIFGSTYLLVTYISIYRVRKASEDTSRNFRRTENEIVSG